MARLSVLYIIKYYYTLLYIELAISFPIDPEHTVNFRNFRIESKRLVFAPGFHICAVNIR